MHLPHGSPKTSPVPAWLLAAACAGALGCGPTVFQGRSAMSVSGDLPAPPAPPPAAPARVELTRDKIVIHEKVQFDFNAATIKPESHGLLDEVADVIKKNPHVKRIAIEGHASSEGADGYNLRLSDERAKAVMDYLVGKGIPKEALAAKGYGEKKPIADNETDEGREKNRRVEFNIVEQDASAAPVASTGDAPKGGAE